MFATICSRTNIIKMADFNGGQRSSFAIYGAIMKQLVHENASFSMTDFRQSSTFLNKAAKRRSVFRLTIYTINHREH